MTAIIAWHDGKRGYMAADRRTMAAGEIIADDCTKIIRCGKWLVACSGTSLMRCLLSEAAGELAKAAGPLDLASRAKKIIEEFGWHAQAKEVGGPPQIDANLLAVHAEHGAFVFFDNFSYQRQDRPCNGGCGGNLAAGAFEALRRLPGADITEAMRQAILVAEHFNSWCGGDPQVEVVYSAQASKLEAVA